MVVFGDNFAVEVVPPCTYVHVSAYEPERGGIQVVVQANTAEMNTCIHPHLRQNTPTYGTEHGSRRSSCDKMFAASAAVRLLAAGSLQVSQQHPIMPRPSHSLPRATNSDSNLFNIHSTHCHGNSCFNAGTASPQSAIGERWLARSAAV